MTIEHKINNDRKLITTTVAAAATDSNLIEALSKYQENIKSRPEYDLFNEIVDFSSVDKFMLSTEGIKKLVQIAAQADVAGKRTKLAIIVTQPVAFGLARMYQIYRSLQPHALKELRIFMKYEDALEWIQRKS